MPRKPTRSRVEDDDRLLERIDDLDEDEELEESADGATGARRRGVWGWLRRPQPSGGPRIAIAYAVSVAAALLGAGPAAAIVTSLYQKQAICPTDDFACPLVTLFAAIAGATAALLLIGALLGRLGWLWWLLVCALAIGMFQLVAADATNPAFLLVFVAPLIAALLTDPAPVWRPEVRWWLALGLSVAIIVEVGIQTGIALR